MLDYAEKRDFQRMAIECPAQFRLPNADKISGAIVKNLCSGGMLLWVEQEVEPGVKINIEVLPGKTITPPLSAQVNVLRCYELEEGVWAAACAIEKIFSEEEVGANFP